MQDKPVLITSLDELKKLATTGDDDQREMLEVFIALNGGIKSSKVIWYDEREIPKNGKPWTIYHEISGTYQRLGDRGFKKTHLMEAIEKKALFKY